MLRTLSVYNGHVHWYVNLLSTNMFQFTVMLIYGCSLGPLSLLYCAAGSYLILGPFKCENRGFWHRIGYETRYNSGKSIWGKTNEQYGMWKPWHIWHCTCNTDTNVATRKHIHLVNHQHSHHTYWITRTLVGVTRMYWNCLDELYTNAPCALCSRSRTRQHAIFLMSNA